MRRNVLPCLLVSGLLLACGGTGGGGGSHADDVLAGDVAAGDALDVGLVPDTDAPEDVPAPYDAEGDEGPVPDDGPPPKDVPDEGQPPEDVPDEGQPPEDVPDEGKPPEDVPDEGKPPEDVPDEGQPPEDVPDEGQPPEDVPDEGQPPKDEGQPLDVPPVDVPPVEVTQPDVGPSAEVCDDEKDNDGDTLVDCDDPDCELTADCSPTCEPTAKVGCGSTTKAGTDGAGATDMLSSYSCSAGLYTGPEVSWSFTVSEPTVVAASLGKKDDATDLMVIEGVDGACLPQVCIASGIDSALFVALPGKTYFLVVDGLEGAVGGFELGVSCEKCVPSCAGKSCGSDGCGGSCGACSAGQVCGPDHTCLVPPKENDCAGAKTIGAVPYKGYGDSSDAVDTYAALGAGCGPVGLGGGPDVVYSLVPSSTDVFRIALTGHEFLAALYVVTDCDKPKASCVGGTASPDSDLDVGLSAGKKYYVVVDGLDELESGFFAIDVKSLGPCTPSCAVCGVPDGCGGSCPCDPVPNDTCAKAIAIAPSSLPATIEGTTAGAKDDYQAPKGSCPGAPWYGYGGGGADVVYSFTPNTTGSYTFSLPVTKGADFDAALYIVTDCGAVAKSCIAGDEVWNFGGETVTAVLVAGTKYYVVVDGFSDKGSLPMAGAFEMSVKVCAGSCAGKACGDNGCGVSCGTCKAGEFCAAGTCKGVPTNEDCATAEVIAAVPFTTVSTTKGMQSDFYISEEMSDVCHYEFECTEKPVPPATCEPVLPDAVWSFKATKTGVYTVAVTAMETSAPAVIVTGDCAEPADSCMGFGWTGMPVYAEMVAGKTYTIIVDDDPKPGPFELSVELCTPDCAGKACGNDGCGGSCGECGGDDYCLKGECVAPGCGDLVWQGCCKGDELYYCDGDEIVFEDCSGTSGCGWSHQMDWYGCGYEGADPTGEHPIACPDGL